MPLLDLFRPRAPSPPPPVAARVEPQIKSGFDSGGLPLANNADYAMVGSSLVSGSYGVSSTGTPITPWTAITSSAVFGCVRVLSEDLAKLPIQIMRRLGNGGWMIDEDHRLNTVFATPNRWHNAFDLICFLATSLAMRGNAFAAVLRDAAGKPVSILPITPDRVSVLLAQSGEILYHVSHQTVVNDAGFVLGRNDCVHVKGISLNGYTGVGPIEANANAIGLALALELHGGSMFRNGATMGGFLKVAGKLSPESMARISDSMAARHSGAANAGKIMVLENGSDFVPIVMTSQEAQYLESRQASVVEIARIFRVPPHKLMALEESHYNNLESQNQAFIDDSLLPTARRMEQEFERVLLFEAEVGRIRIRFNFDEMLRGDLSTRFNSYAVGITNGILSRNEVRSREGLAPVPGGDSFLTPLNMGDPNRPDDPMPSDK